MPDSNSDDGSRRLISQSLDAALRDVRHGLRGFKRNPILTGVAIVSLALGIGGNVATFSVLSALFLESAPVRRPAELVSIYTTRPDQPGPALTSFKNFDDLRKSLPVPAAAYASILVGISEPSGEAEQVSGELVSDNYFQVLGVGAVRGRTFLPEEGKIDGQNPVVVISDALWQRRFAAQDVIGRTILVNTKPFRIVGIAPAGYRGLDLGRAVDVWIMTSMHADALAGIQAFYYRVRVSSMFDVVARVASDEALAALTARLKTQARDLATAFPAENNGLAFDVLPLQQARLGPQRRATWLRAGGLLAAVVALVLLIACANVANLLLAQAVMRRHEISLRRALGASNGRLRRQLLTEAALLAVAGAGIGIGVAYMSLRWAMGGHFLILPRSLQLGLDGKALTVAAAAGVCSTFLFGLAPALYATQGDISSGLRGGRIASGRLSGDRFSRLLLVAQSTLATTALILAVLFVRSLRNAQRIDPGFKTDHLALATFDLGLLRYDSERAPALVRRVLERINRIPGVTSSTISSHVVLDGPGLQSKITLPGRADAEDIGAHAQAVGRDYFRTMGLAVAAGRTFREDDSAPSKFGWAVVNMTMAQTVWPDRPAVGQRFAISGIPEQYEVIGVVANSQYESLGETAQPFFYIYYGQATGLKKLSLYVRTAVDPASVLPAIARAVHDEDAQLPLIDLRTMADVLRKATAAPRAGSILLSAMGFLSVMLALMGTYGVTAFVVGRRRRDIGIRRALGASNSEVLLPFIRSTFLPALMGVVIGAALTVMASRLLSGLLVAVKPSDPVSLASATLIIVGSALATFVPAMSAIRSNVAVVLRNEA